MKAERVLFCAFLMLGILGVFSVSAISFPDNMTHISRSFPSSIQNSEKHIDLKGETHQVSRSEKKFSSELYTFFKFDGGNLVRFQKYTETLTVTEGDLDYTINPFRENYTFGLIYEFRSAIYKVDSLTTIYFFRLFPFFLVAVYIFYLLSRSQEKNRLRYLVMLVHLTNPIFVWFFTSLHPLNLVICGFVMISLKLNSIEIEKEVYKPTKLSLFMQASTCLLLSFISGRISIFYFTLLYLYFLIIHRDNKNKLSFKDSKLIAMTKVTTSLKGWKRYFDKTIPTIYVMVIFLSLIMFLGVQIMRNSSYWGRQNLQSFLIHMVNVVDGFSILIRGLFGGNVNFEERSFFANYNAYTSNNLVDLGVWLAVLASLLMVYFNLKNGLVKITTLKVFILALVALPAILYKSLTFFDFNIQYHHLVFLYLFWVIFMIPKQVNRLQIEVLATTHFLFLPIFALQWMQLIGTYQDSTLEKLGVTNSASQAWIEEHLWHFPFANFFILGAYFVLAISFLRELLKR